jgi:hypothetical protein
MKPNPVKLKTVKLIAKLLRPWVDESIISVPESRAVIAALRRLAERGDLIPVTQPKLLNQREVASALGLSLSSFKKQEREGNIRVPRKYIGTSLRYRSTDVMMFILSKDDETE